jgi:hypothetical protein
LASESGLESKKQAEPSYSFSFRFAAGRINDRRRTLFIEQPVAGAQSG